jgi:hypothetical protein
MSVFWRSLVVWLTFMSAEVVLGTVRVLWIEPVLTGQRAKWLMFPLGMLMILLVAGLMGRWMGARTTKQCVGVGVFWAGLTLSFEVGVGLLRGMSGAEIARDFNPLAGGLMGVGLVWLLIVPGLVAWRLANPRFE